MLYKEQAAAKKKNQDYSLQCFGHRQRDIPFILAFGDQAMKEFDLVLHDDTLEECIHSILELCVLEDDTMLVELIVNNFHLLTDEQIRLAFTSEAIDSLIQLSIPFSSEKGYEAIDLCTMLLGRNTDVDFITVQMSGAFLNGAFENINILKMQSLIKFISAIPKERFGILQMEFLISVWDNINETELFIYELVEPLAVMLSNISRKLIDIPAEMILQLHRCVTPWAEMVVTGLQHQECTEHIYTVLVSLLKYQRHIRNEIGNADPVITSIDIICDLLNDEPTAKLLKEAYLAKLIDGRQLTTIYTTLPWTAKEALGREMINLEEELWLRDVCQSNPNIEDVTLIPGTEMCEEEVETLQYQLKSFRDDLGLSSEEESGDYEETEHSGEEHD